MPDDGGGMIDFDDLPNDERMHALVLLAHVLAAELSGNDIDRLAWRLQRSQTPSDVQTLAALRWITEHPA